jgi:uncharacterized repeat protein (TIGR03803 family)
MTHAEAKRQFFSGTWRQTTRTLALIFAVMPLVSAAQVTQAQTFKTLHAFQGSPDGSTPQYVNLIVDAKGNLWGTTRIGGKQNSGTVFKVDKKHHESVFYSFTGGSFGQAPYAGFIEDAKGNFYGTTRTGGIYQLGNVYKLDAKGNETDLYDFAGNSQGGSDGADPEDALIRDSKGNFYGTTEDGGTDNFGTVFKLDAQGNETVLYSFTGKADGKYPIGGLVQDADGNLYGTTLEAGIDGWGTAFKINSKGHFMLFHTFAGPDNDGATPYSGMVIDAADNLYGTTSAGGMSSEGAVYKFDKTGKETILHSFGSEDGESPIGGLFMDPSGNLYGTTAGSGFGSSPYGTVFKLTKKKVKKKITYSYKILYSFMRRTDGSSPWGGVVVDTAGNIYGTTTYAGDPICLCGTVFELSQ